MTHSAFIVRRHDRVHVAPEAALQIVSCGDPLPQAKAVRAWLEAGLPLVGARQPEVADGHVVLGLTLPPGSAVRRIGVRVLAASIRQVEPALTVARCAALLPATLRVPLLRLAEALRALGVRVGVYGSLAWQATSGQAYWRDGGREPSDIDLICDVPGNVPDAGQLSACIDRLAALDAALPLRIDGEIRLGGTRAVAWRELLAARGRCDVQVLVKGERRVWLSTVDAFVNGHEPEHEHAHEHEPARQRSSRELADADA